MRGTEQLECGEIGQGITRYLGAERWCWGKKRPHSCVHELDMLGIAECNVSNGPGQAAIKKA